MKILVVADHEEKYIWDYFDKERFKDIELIISCGDLKKQYLSFLVTMITAPLFYVPGNHNTKFEKDPPLGCDSIDDKVVNYKGFNIMGLGGSYLYSYENYQYTEKEMHKRIRKLKRKIKKAGGVDILVTHAPAYKMGDGEDRCHRGFESFVEFIDTYSPKYFFHGHQHLNYGKGERLSKYKTTTIVNGYGYYIIDVTKE